MARDVELDIVARDKTGGGVRGAMRAFDRLKAKVQAATDTMSGGILNVFKGLPPQVQAVAVAAAVTIGVAMSAAIGAAITAGILLAVGGGVLAAGIKAAADSPQVKAAWTRFTGRGKKAFADFGKPFEGPVQRALETFGDTVERIAPTLKRMGESMAPVIDKLAPALADMAENALPGIEKALEAGKPLWDTLAEHMPEIGAAISKFFGSIAEGGPGANLFLKDFLTWLEGSIIILGKVIGWLAKLYVKAREVWSGITQVFVAGVRVVLAVLGKIITGAAEAFGWIPGIGPKLKAAAGKFTEFQQKANAELDKIKDENVNVLIHVKAVGAAAAKGAIAAAAAVSGKRAAGGPVSAGQSYLVGERGPEILTMGPRGGHITPNHELGGPQVLEAHIEIGGEVVRVVQVQMRERDRQLKRRVGAGAGR